MDLVRAVGRLLIAWLFVNAGQDVLRHPEGRAKVATPLLDRLHATVPFLPDDNVLLVQTNAAVQIGAAVALALGRFPRFAALVLASSLVPTTLAGHPFWRHDDPASRAQQRIHFNKNLAIIGGLLFSAAESKTSRRLR